MKKWFFVGVLFWLFSTANAQKPDLYFSVHGAIQLASIFNPTGETGINTVPLPGLRLAFELGDSTWRGGMAFSSVGVFIFFGSVTTQVYLKYLQPDFFAIYGGVGYTLQYALFDTARNHYHVLLGLEMPGGWSIEFTPGIALATRYIYEPPVSGTFPPYYRVVQVSSFTMGISLGWSWKF
jgi:hypothetical protein